MPSNSTFSIVDIPTAVSSQIQWLKEEFNEIGQAIQIVKDFYIVTCYLSDDSVTNYPTQGHENAIRYMKEDIGAGAKDGQPCVEFIYAWNPFSRELLVPLSSKPHLKRELQNILTRCSKQTTIVQDGDYIKNITYLHFL